MINAFLSLIIPHRNEPGIDFRIQKQLPFIAATASFLLLTFALLLPLYLISTKGDFNLFAFMLIGLVALLVGAIILMRQKKYKNAAWLVTVTLFISCMAVLFLMPYRGEVSEAYRPFAFIATMCTCNVLISLEKKQIILMYIGVILAWVLSFLTLFHPLFAMNRSLTIAVFGTGFLGLSVGNTVLLFVKRLSEELLDTAQKQTEAAQSSLANLTKVMEEARDGMAIGEQILDASGRVQTSLSEVEKIQHYLSGSSENLMKESDSFTVSASAVLDSAQSMKGSLQEQNAAITETSAAITEISANLASISGIATKRREMLNDISKAGYSQKELVKKLVAAVTSVQTSSEGISVFVHTVQDVASKTGLLAMNASIEAARAGSSGKGFAVIAQEIRILSEETQRNAETIKNLLDENDRTVESSSEMAKDFSTFVDKNVHDTKILTESIDEILRGITEMDTGTREVMQAAQEIVTVAQSSNEMVTTVVSQVNSQKEGFTNIAGISTELHDRIILLDKAVREIHSAADLVVDAGRLNTAQVKKLQMHL